MKLSCQLDDCGRARRSTRPVCDTHWELAPAVMRTNVWVANRKRDGDAFEIACAQLVWFVKHLPKTGGKA